MSLKAFFVRRCWIGHLLAVIALAVLMFGTPATADESLSEAEIDALAERILDYYPVPGLALGIVKDGEVVHAKGYGVRELGRRERIDDKTLFKIASNSKAFTAASLAILVDEGKLAWDDKIIDHMPEFRLHDPWVTREFTVIDLLTHRSGLAPFVGDLMLWPEPNNFSRDDIRDNLRYFKPESGFRSEYAYDNLLYIVAGELVPAITGERWESFVDERIMGALDADRCFAGTLSKRDMRNVALPHGEVEGRLQVIERSRIVAEPNTSVAAGGIRCSLKDMVTWAQVQLNRGVTPDGEVLFSVEQSEAMWQPYTIRSVSQRDTEVNQTHFKAYGLGWRLADVHGYLEVAHTGTLSGWNSNMVLIPEVNLGVVVLTNGSSGRAREVLANTVVRKYMGEGVTDWIAWYEAEDARRAAEAAANGEEATADELPAGQALAPFASLEAYAGVFEDDWFGRVDITIKEGVLWFSAEKSPKLTGPMEPWRGDTFIARWTDRSVDGDAYVTFTGDTPGEFARIVMRSVDKRSDFEFEDLDLRRR